LQEDLLQHLFDVAKIYMAATISNFFDGGDVGLVSTRRCVTMLSILACFDACIRNKCENIKVKQGLLEKNESFNCSLADVLSDNMLLNIHGEAATTWKLQNENPRGEISAPWGSEDFVADDPAVAETVSSCRLYFEAQQDAVPAERRYEMLGVFYGSAGLSQEDNLINMTPPFRKSYDDPPHVDGIFKLIDDMLDMWGCEIELIPPCLAGIRYRQEGKDKGPNDGLEKLPDGSLDPHKLKRFFRCGGWLENMTKLIPEFKQLVQIQFLYKHAMKLATTDSLPWIRTGDVVDWKSNEMIHGPYFKMSDMDTWETVHEFFYDVIVAGEPFRKKTPKALPSYPRNVMQTLQLQCFEDPQRERFSEDTVVYASTLPTFDNTLSEEDAENLLSCFAESSLRVSMLLDFFSHGRVGTLLNRSIRQLFVGGLYELGFISPEDPLIQAFPHVKGPLTTPTGHLLYELKHHRSGVLSGVVSMLTEAINAAQNMTYQAPYRTAILFLSLTAGRMLCFCESGADVELLVRAVRDELLPLLQRWNSAALSDCQYRDAESFTRAISYLYLIFVSVDIGDILEAAAIGLGCMEYCITWHAELDISDQASMSAAAHEIGIKLRLADLFQHYQRVRHKISKAFLAATSSQLSSGCAMAAKYAVGTDGKELGVGVSWTHLDPRKDGCSEVAFGSGDGVLIVDIAAGRVLVQRSKVKPTPDAFRTQDFTDFFGEAVPNCIIESDRVHCKKVAPQPIYP